MAHIKRKKKNKSTPTPTLCFFPSSLISSGNYQDAINMRTSKPQISEGAELLWRETRSSSSREGFGFIFSASHTCWVIRAFPIFWHGGNGMLRQDIILSHSAGNVTVWCWHRARLPSPHNMLHIPSWQCFFQAPGSNPGVILLPLSHWISLERGAPGENALAAARESIKTPSAQSFLGVWSRFFFSLLFGTDTFHWEIFWSNKHKLLVFLRQLGSRLKCLLRRFVDKCWAMSLFIRAALAARNLYFSQISRKGFILEKRHGLHRYFFPRSLQVYLPLLLPNTNGIKP